MTDKTPKPAPAPAAPPAQPTEPENPAAGGSYVRDPITGALTPAPATPTE